jgi:hypothetical protein
MFWHGAALTRIERLSMASFLAHHHRLRLHVYEEPHGVPAGVELADARDTLPENNLFRHRKSGSYAIFADWFRYRLLQLRGGIWADTDMVCLRPLNFAVDELYAWQDESAINMALLGLPAGHPLATWMVRCCEQPNRIKPYDDWRMRWRKIRRGWLGRNSRRDVRWGESGPAGFTAAARHLGYVDRALPSWHFYPVHFSNWKSVFDGTLSAGDPLLARSSALHLWNEMTRREPGFDKDGRFPAHSLFEQLCARYLRTAPSDIPRRP